MTTPAILELAVAVALIGLAIWLYAKRSREGARYGSQSAVFLLLIGVLVGMHALGLFSYRPSQAEIESQSLPPSPGSVR